MGQVPRMVLAMAKTTKKPPSHASARAASQASIARFTPKPQ